MKENFIKLMEPVLYDHKNDVAFTIVTQVCLDNLKYGQLTIKGKSYDYDSGKAEHEKEVEIILNLEENAIFPLGENGEIID